MRIKTFYLLFMVFSASIYYSCANDGAHANPSKEILEIYSIVLGDDTTKIGKLTYKEAKYFNDKNQVIKQEYFDKQGELKGVEYIDRNKNKRHSEYYTPDSSLLSYYDMVYDMDILQLKSAFDGSTGEFLRAEQYKYDDKGNRLEKIILDQEGVVNRVYKFVYDEYGNETGFSGFDENGKLFLLETYVITKKDKLNRWTEKWGKRDNVPYSYYKRSFYN